MDEQKQEKSKEQALEERIAQLESLLRATVDPGRIAVYEQSREGKKPAKVKLSLWQDGIVVGWRTIKDILVRHATTGKVVGEEQEYEVLVQDNGGMISPHKVQSYNAFSNARYDNRVDAEVIGKTEDLNGKTTFNLQLPDGRKVEIDARFVN